MLCWGCGALTEKTLNGIPYCVNCYDYARLQAKALEKQRQEVRVRTMYDKAVTALFKSGFEIDGHKKESEWVLQAALKNPAMIASAPEMVVAVALTVLRIPLKCQTKIAGFQVDFCIMPHKIILEIDGDRHQWEIDRARDEYLYKCLPEGWIIVRLKANFVMNNPQNLIKEIERRVSKARGAFGFDIRGGGN